MSLADEVNQAEERLFNRFQDSLEEYYAWEEQAQQEFLASIYPEEEEE